MIINTLILQVDKKITKNPHLSIDKWGFYKIMFFLNI